MSDVIKVENLFKQYRLGQVSTGSIAHDLNRWWHTVRGKDDPYEKITGLNNRDEADSNEYVWALQDINFSVKQGEVLGIIGRNGAGKSTLLKILSKVTSPTKGNIKVKGRIASLLEVGTGFHPELTGRENIFLNGAILGMTKTEIRSKFDEIVAFSGVEKYIDTPVKRYSSGMYVRLAFAVAAHLEPEILIVDEVLAVGDAEFQKKCLGKMKDVSGEGRTVLFVSHNMEAILSLTERTLLMERGKLNSVGETNEIINKYFLLNNNNSQTYYDEKNSHKFPFIKSVNIKTTFENNIQKCMDPLDIKICVKTGISVENICLSIHIVNEKGISVVHTGTNFSDLKLYDSKGEIELQCQFPKLKLFMGLYYLTIYLAEPPGGKVFQVVEMICPFEVKMFDYPRELFEWNKSSRQYIEESNWKKNEI
jgi:lipopolysaccharide transport system ATP-binding protein